jgi:hypothetical protein
MFTDIGAGVPVSCPLIQKLKIPPLLTHATWFIELRAIVPVDPAI